MISESLSDIGAVIFAGCDTLFDFPSVARTCAAELDGKADELAAAWRAARSARAARATDPDEGDFWEMTGDALDEAMGELGFDDAALRARLMQKVLNVDPYPDAEPAVREVKEGRRRVAVLSNATMTMVVSALKHGGLSPHVDEVISCVPGHFKPAPEAYARVPERMRLPPERLCYVSATARDARAAGQAGLAPVWLDRGDSGDAPSGRPEARIATLADLPGLLVS